MAEDPGAEPRRLRLPLNVLYEDADLVAVDKPPGMTVVPAVGVDALIDVLSQARRERLWAVHRLDRDTTGVVLFARNAEAHRVLSLAFEHREVEKTYVAFAAGDVQAGRIDVPLHDARRGRMRPARPGEAGSKEAVTEVVRQAGWVMDEGSVSKLVCRPLTGRRHQIRVHLRSVGAPVLSDDTYGRSRMPSVPVPRLALHAAAVRLPGPRELTIEASLPGDLVALEAWLDERAPRTG